MKLKKTLLLCLAITMVLTMTLPAMAKPQAEKLQWLIDEKIIEGRNNNGVIDFAYGENLKRSEFAKIVILSGGFKESDADALKRYDSFPDVSESYWARGYINLSKHKGMIEGFDDGKFYPENFVTFAQVCAMLVRMDSRWDKDKPTNIQWPDTYLNYAKSYGILEDVTPVGADDFVRRDMAFEMLYNHMQTKDSANTYTVTFDYDAKLGIKGYLKGDRDNDYPEVYKKEFSVTEAKVAKDKEIKANQIPTGISVKQYPTDGGNTIVTWYLQGWFEKPDGKGDQLKAGTKIKANTTYYAYWSTEKALGYADNFRVTQPDAIVAPVGTSFDNLDLPRTVKVTFDRNSGIDRRYDGDYRITWRSGDYNPAAEGDQVILGDLDSRSLPDKANFVNPLASIKVTRTPQNITATFSASDATTGKTITKTTENGSIAAPKRGDVKKTDASGNVLTVSQWKSNAGYVAPGGTINLTQDTTFTPVDWVILTPAKETVTVTVKDGNTTLKTVSVDKGASFDSVKEKLMPTAKEGYAFTVFSDAPDTFNKDTTITAQWEKVSTPGTPETSDTGTDKTGTDKTGTDKTGTDKTGTDKTDATN